MTDPSAAGRAVLQRPAPGSYVQRHLFIGGEWRAPADERSITVEDAATRDQIGSVPSASPADVRRAVEAAVSAQPTWSAMPRQDRAEVLTTLRSKLSGSVSELAALVSSEVGTATRLSPAIQVESALGILAEAIRLLVEWPDDEMLGNSSVTREPIGVVAAVTPWNFPLFQTMAKVAAALAAGCTVVHKPSSLAPLTSFVLARAVEESGLPAGAYNLVTGSGPDSGAELVRHPGVDMVSFTGSTEAGSRVYETAARSIKRVALELGGKSPSIILDDGDVALAVKATVNRAFLNSGQTCDAWTRLIAPESLIPDVLELATDAAQRLPLGDPFDPATRLGPLINEAQAESVRKHITTAQADGAMTVTGGAEEPADLPPGSYVQPTILADVTPDMAIAQEEVFGPVLVVQSYRTEDEAVDLANNTRYGLSSAVWSRDATRAEAVARRVKTGQVVINGGRFNPLAPFGGVKQSGLGRELGRYGIEEYLTLKAIQR